jgi:hypothetical protein
MLVLMQARIGINRNDTVRYVPKFHDPHRHELATVEDVVDKSDEPIQVGPEASPYWLKVRFMNDGQVRTLNAQAFVVEEVRQTIARPI